METMTETIQTCASSVGVGEVEYRVDFLRADGELMHVCVTSYYVSQDEANRAANKAVFTGDPPGPERPPTEIVRAVVTETTVLAVHGRGPR